MELYKFINERNIKKYNGGFVVLDGMIYTNPHEDTLKSAGFKPLAAGEMPEHDEQTQYVDVTYIDGEDAISVSYEVLNYDNAEEITDAI